MFSLRFCALSGSPNVSAQLSNWIRGLSWGAFLIHPSNSTFNSPAETPRRVRSACCRRTSSARISRTELASSAGVTVVEKIKIKKSLNNSCFPASTHTRRPRVFALSRDLDAERRRHAFVIFFLKDVLTKRNEDGRHVLVIHESACARVCDQKLTAVLSVSSAAQVMLQRPNSAAHRRTR